MLLTPADRGPGARQDTGHAAPADAWLAAPVSELSAPLTPRAARLAQAGALAGQPADGGPESGLAEASIRHGGCFVRQLPLESTCAGAARRFFREALAGADLPGDLIHDGVTMASELAANTMNAHGNVEYGGQGHRPVSGMPEFWLYLRGCGSGREIVCKFFDSEPGWDAGEPLPVGAAVPAGPDSVRGRGLQMVAGLSAGRWGHHLSRGRLGAWKVEGKAVWFALRIPATSDLARSERLAPRGARAVAELAAALADRGLGAGLVPVTESGGDLAVLSVSRQLTVWCRGEVVWWQEPDGGYDRLTVSDLVEAAERIVCAHEDLLAARAGELANAEDSACDDQEAE
ncbi:MAG TPA: hypothetical protein VMU94_13675 [Streptosporangiaceae bacterium]|nr:hypothetical protein [Streptosporangiaceae bacterium]